MSTQWFEQLIRNRNNDLVKMQVDIITASQKGKGKKKKKKVTIKTKDEVSELLASLTKEEVLKLLGELDA